MRDATEEKFSSQPDLCDNAAASSVSSPQSKHTNTIVADSRLESERCHELLDGDTSISDDPAQEIRLELAVIRDGERLTLATRIA
jgi:hypothetical protein